MFSVGGNLTQRTGYWFVRLSKVIDDGAGGLIETDLLDEYSFGLRLPVTYAIMVPEELKLANGLEFIINPKEGLCFEVTEVLTSMQGNNNTDLLFELEIFSRNA